MRQLLVCLLTILVTGLGLTGCFARRLELEDPMGLPLNDPSLGVEVQSAAAPALAKQLQDELIRLLPRERGVRAQAAPGDYSLSIDLERRRELADAVPLFSGIAPGQRVHLEIGLEASLAGPSGEPRRWQLVQRGDALPSAEAELEAALLNRLRDLLIRELQPSYSYR